MAIEASMYTYMVSSINDVEVHMDVHHGGVHICLLLNDVDRQDGNRSWMHR